LKKLKCDPSCPNDDPVLLDVLSPSSGVSMRLRGKRNGARSFSVSCNVSRGPVFFAQPTENERMMMWRNCCVGSIFIFYLGWNFWVQCFWAFRILPQEYRCSVHIPLSNAPLTPFALLRGVSKSGAREQNADSITLDLFGEQKTRAASTRPIKAPQVLSEIVPPWRLWAWTIRPPWTWIWRHR
jgi:hypothetical protein